jgi:DNA polymerase III epsilon subunit-like protein
MSLPYRNIIVFDTETTGLIPKQNKTTKEPPSIDQFPYITQLSFIVYDTVLETVRSSYNNYIKLPEGIEVPPIVTEITGITTEKCNEEGIEIKEALSVLYHAIILCDSVVGHNIEFDIKMVNAELKRNAEFLPPKFQDLFNPKRMLQLGINTDCTMRMTTDACSIYVTNERNQKYKKFPKLVETYTHLFHEIPENLHNSLIDALVCLRCYLKFRFGIQINDHRFAELMERATKNEL